MIGEYEGAREIAVAALSSLDLPDYTGDVADLAYLRGWLVTKLASFYNVSPSVFDAATIYSTSIVRDFVHRVLMQVPANCPNVGSGAFLSDVGAGFRTRGTGLCGTVNGTLINCWRALGFTARYIDSVTGPVDDYDGSHVQTEVWIPALSKYVVQDAFYNMAPFADGAPLSWIEQRAANGSAFYDHFAIYNYFRSTGEPATEWDETDRSYLNGTRPSRGPIWSVPFWVRQASSNGALTATWNATRLFPDWRRARDPAINQGGTFDDALTARNVVRGLRAMGLSWLQIAYWLRAEGKYVTGFKTPSTSWITVRLSNGGYHTFRLENDLSFPGALDELWCASVTLTDVHVVDFDGNVWTGLSPSVAADELRDAPEIDAARAALAAVA